MFIRNIETGELVPIDAVDVGGLTSDVDRPKTERLILGPGQSPTVLIELHFEATNNYTKQKYPIKGDCQIIDSNSQE